jgi:hypothetical protein
MQMLCDEIIQLKIKTDGLIPEEIFYPIIERIRKAVKFNLTPEFTQAADALATDIAQVTKALEFCRLPYPEIWIECSQSQRPNFMAGQPPAAWQGVPQKIGFLLTTKRDDLSAFKAHQFWSIRNPINGNQDRCVSMLATVFDMRGGLDENVDTTTTPFHSTAWQRATISDRHTLMSTVDACLPDFPSLVIDDKTGAYANMAASDWVGEPHFIEAVLALLNCRNVHETVYVDKTEHNRKRTRKNKQPLSSYHLVKINSHHIVRSGHSEHDSHSALRAHFVRGHFKHRKTGLYFWRPHQRGQMSIGSVTKDYEVNV